MVTIQATACGKKQNMPCITTQVGICPIPFHYDPYVGCSHGCLYCFARDNVNFWRRKSGLEFDNLEFNSVKHFHTRLHASLVKPMDFNDPLSVFLKKRVPIKIGANSDPFPAIEAKNRVTYHVLKILMGLDYPVQVQTKRPEVFLSYAEEFKDYKNICLSVTIPFSDDFAKLIEPNITPSSVRFQSIQALTRMGFNVMVKCQPAIYRIILNDLDFLVQNTAESGCWAFQTEGLKLRKAASAKEKTHFIKLGEIIGIKNIYDWYRKELVTASDYELSVINKLEYTQKAKDLSHSYGLRYFSADNQKECIALSDSDECCGTEKLSNYTTFSYNYRTQVFTNKPWHELENDLSQCQHTPRNHTRTSLKQLVDHKLGNIGNCNGHEGTY